MKRFLLLFSFILIVITLFMGSAAFSAVVYVKGDSPGPVYDGKTWATAFRKIQDGVNAAVTGDELRVAKGTYKESIQLTSGITLRGGYAGDGDTRDPNRYVSTIATPGSRYTALITDAPSTAVDGFTFLEGFPAILCKNSTAITNNTFQSFSAAIYCDASSPVIERNRFVGTASSSSGVKCANSAGPTIRCNTFRSLNTGIAADSVSGCQIVGNFITANGNGINVGAGTATIVNNTIVANDLYTSSGYGNGIIAVSGVTIANNIIAFQPCGISTNGPSTMTLSHNLVYGNGSNYVNVSKGSTDLSADPQIASLEFGNVHIRPTSPARNAGDVGYSNLSTNDIDGQSRIEGSSIDIGADESAGETYPSPYTPRVIYVDSTAPAGGDGTSWNSAYKTIQSATNDVMATEPGEIWVAQGTYQEQVVLPPFTDIMGGFAAGDGRADRNPKTKVTTVLATDKYNQIGITTSEYSNVDGITVQGAYQGVACKGTNPVVSNCTLTNNATAVYCGTQQPTITACNISDNGYGIYCSTTSYKPTPIVTNNVITRNGSGAVIGSAGTLVGNIIAKNGDGVCAWKAINNTIVCNGGIAVNAYTSGTPAVVANNIVMGNYIGINTTNCGTAVSIANNLVYSNSTDYSPSTVSHPTDIAADPNFASSIGTDYHITSGSPCKNAGNNASISTSDYPKDIDGQPRLFENRVDIGADEYNGEVYPPAQNRIIYVSAAATAGGDGTSWERAYKTIAAAVSDASINGATAIWVAQGTYTETIVFFPGLQVLGGFAPGDTMVERNPAIKQTIIKPDVVGAHGTVLDGFFIKGTGSSSGIRCLSRNNMTISNNIVSGACIALVGNASVVRNNTVFGCTGNAAISVDTTTATVTGNRLYSNTNGITAHQGNAILSGNTIYLNTGWGVRLEGIAAVTNNTVVANGAEGLLIASGGANSAISNNILYANLYGIRSATTFSTLSHNCVYGNTNNYTGITAGATDISKDPGLAGIPFADFHIQPDSSCRNAGDNNAPGLPTTDIDGQNRLNGTVDIGADESYGEVVPSPRIVYVNGAATSGGNGTTWEKAYTTIQAALDDISRLGPAEVWVAQGEYQEQITVPMYAHLKGGFAVGDSRADRNPKTKLTTIHPVTHGANCNIVTGNSIWSIDGFTLRSGYQLLGVSCGSGVAPVSLKTPLQVVSNCTISDNLTGIYGSSPGILINNNTVMSNGTGISTSGSSSAGPLVSGNVILANNTGITCSGGLLTNNTVVGNKTGIYTQSQYPSIANNIIAYNAEGVSASSTTGALVALSHNNVFGNRSSDYSHSTMVHATDISVDPQFASLESGNLHIKATSPCRDAGDAMIQGATLPDIDGQSRPEGAAVDMGADESYGESYSSNYPIQVIYVDAQAQAGGDGSSWSTAYNSIQAAISAATPYAPAEIRLAAGTYRESVQMKPYVKLYGGFPAGGDMTSRNPRDNRTVICPGSATSNAITASYYNLVDGFVINGAGVGINCDTNNAMLCTFQNNVILSARTGINAMGMSPVISSNRITNCSLGIIMHSGTPTIVNNALLSNTTGILAQGGSAAIINNTIADNAVNGVDCSLSAPRMVNNIVYANGVGVLAGSTPPVLSHNNVFGNTGGNYSPDTIVRNTDISADPQIAGLSEWNYHIQPTSPCKDAGDTSAAGAPAVDIDGQTRPYGNCIDIGADESYGETYSEAQPNRIVYVYSGAQTQGDGTSWASAYRSVVDAAADIQAKGPAEIWVAAGIYVGNVDLSACRGLYGGFDGSESTKESRRPDANVTVLDANGVGSALTLSGAMPITVDGFTIRNSGSYGIIVYWNSNVSISSNTITGNANGVYSEATMTTLQDNHILDNRLVGAYTYGRASIMRNEFRRNAGGAVSAESGIINAENNIVDSNGSASTVYPGIKCSGQAGSTVAHNMVVNNKALFPPKSSSQRSVALSGEGAVITDNTVSKNNCDGIFGGTSISDNTVSLNDGHGIVTAYASVLHNSIIRNQGIGVTVTIQTPLTPTVAHNNIEGNSGAGISITRCNAQIYNNLVKGNGGGILSPYSAATITNNTVISNDCVYDGTYAPPATPGAITIGSGGSVINNIVAFNNVGIKAPTTGAIIKNNCVYSNTDANYVTIANQTGINGNISVDPGIVSARFGEPHLTPTSHCIGAGYTTSGPMDIGAYEYDGNTYPAETKIVRVTPSGDDGNDGSSWALAKKTIRAAIEEVAASGGEIWVSAGLYQENIVVPPYVYLYGGFDGTETDRLNRKPRTNLTTIDGQKLRCVVKFSGGYRVGTIDGFTVQNGIGEQPYPLPYSGYSGQWGTYGGGILCQSAAPDIINNIIADNTSFIGGGVSVVGPGCRIIGNSILRNRADCGGGGVSLEQPFAVISSNLFKGNSAQADGNALSMGFSAATIVNNTMVANSGSGAGTISYTTLTSPMTSPLTVANNIVVFNSGNAFRLQGTPTLAIRNNCFSEGTGIAPASATSNMFADPLFVNKDAGDYHITASSPCINKGWNDAPGMQLFDCDGESRILGGTVDVGYDEFWPSNLSIADIKKANEGAVIIGTGAVVTAVFQDCFYIELTDRSAGIRVEMNAHELSVGQVVDIVGTISTSANGERCIKATSAAAVGNGTIKPLILTGSGLGGGAFGHQEGVVPGSGLNNLGLLVKVYGRITQIDPSGNYFYVNDGSDLLDGTSTLDETNKGVRVAANGLAYTKGQPVVIIGISSCFKGEDGHLRRLVRMRSAEDVTNM